MLQIQNHNERRRGNAMFIVLVLLVLLAGLAAAQMVVQQTNSKQARFFNSRLDLSSYAESGLAMGIHEINFPAVSSSPGNIGTANWNVTTDDVGRDGQAGTADEGEDDGLPTPGEPNLAPYVIGAGNAQAELLVHVFDEGGGLQRVVATSYNDEASVTLQKMVTPETVRVPRYGALYVPPGVVLDFAGNSFLIDGHDTRPNGDPGPGPDLPGLVTEEAATPGDNAAALLAQIPANLQDQVLGIGGAPSIAESDPVEVGQLVAQLEAGQDQAVAPGSYSNVSWGDDSTPLVTVVNGDVELSGIGTGSGVLLVNGNLTLSGQFEFHGLVLVVGDADLTGGGSGTHIYGGLVVSESMTVGLTGQADVIYSSEHLDVVESVVEANLAANGSYQAVYFDEF